jgi:hypothetical protein
MHRKRPHLGRALVLAEDELGNRHAWHLGLVRPCLPDSQAAVPVPSPRQNAHEEEDRLQFLMDVLPEAVRRLIDTVGLPQAWRRLGGRNRASRAQPFGVCI